MSERIKKLYQRYLEGTLSKDELTDFLQEVGATSDDELWALMEQYNKETDEIPMPDDVKAKQLDFFAGKMHRSRIYPMMKYAAAIACLIISFSIAYWYINGQSLERQMAEVMVEPGSKACVQLPDGSKVILNSGTVLQYDVEPGKYREVKLVKGEAFFDVAKDPTCPFHVSVQDMSIEVLGTTFNVRASDSNVETSLFTGSVKLSIDHSEFTYQLSPGEKSVYHSKNKNFVLAANDHLLDAGWKDGYLAFKSSPLRAVLRQIENWYGVRIRLLDESLGSDLLTGSFRNETLESVLRSLSMQYDFKYENLKNEILIKTK